MSLHEKPIVSIIIPNHNYGNWIIDCINSVVEDPYDRKKIVVVDDGSTDESCKNVLSFLYDVSNLQFKNFYAHKGKFKNTNIELSLIKNNKCFGPSFARNVGIQYIWDSTDVFSFLDSDDMHINGKLKLTVDALLNGWGSIGAVYSDYINFNLEDNIKYEQQKKAFCSEEILVDCIMPSNSLVPKYVFEKIGFFDESMRVAEDWDFWIRMSKFYIGYHIPKFLSLVRIGNYNSTNTVSSEVWINNWAKIREKINNDK